MAKVYTNTHIPSTWPSLNKHLVQSANTIRYLATNQSFPIAGEWHNHSPITSTSDNFNIVASKRAIVLEANGSNGGDDGDDDDSDDDSFKKSVEPLFLLKLCECVALIRQTILLRVKRRMDRIREEEYFAITLETVKHGEMYLSAMTAQDKVQRRLREREMMVEQAIQEDVLDQFGLSIEEYASLSSLGELETATLKTKMKLHDAVLYLRLWKRKRSKTKA